MASNFLPEAKKELFKLDKQTQKIVLAGIWKVSKNPHSHLFYQRK
ncbi:type II toxin-antitoxin system RelE family toxin [Caldicellulosiruptor kronotskyensis]|nr:hypothetical protein [Caldicellulosiruptor kronotskyensis]